MALFEHTRPVCRASQWCSAARRALPLALGALLGGGACSSLASESDVLLDPVGSTGPWRCLTSEDDRPNAVVSPSSLDYSLRVLDLVTQRTPTNLKVRGCALADLTCSRPVTELIEPNADGRVVLPLTTGFDGFLELTADDVGSTLFVFTAALSPQLSTLLGRQPINMLSLESLQTLEQVIGTSDPDQTGTVAITALDCDGQLAAGVRFEITPASDPFAVIAGLPVTQRNTTAADGVVGFVRVPAGVALIDATIVDRAEALEQKTLPIRSGWNTQMTVLPRPLTIE